MSEGGLDFAFDSCPVCGTRIPYPVQDGAVAHCMSPMCLELGSEHGQIVVADECDEDEEGDEDEEEGDEEDDG